ncbi:monofunctional biosynthetic peptidoglycan transglycosylase [Stenoxybacter acetivorans]|uniref:monofunctional biosynthetic peptidoglycan transglycosylase n=1 Tax=Stenoxybacter acetivorans TaxID=422441 RepID=UPI0005653DAC|nr:monofunctional biosynthetic peptidoglycan transglycosylase [Stenoxybacter acetivorans]
MKTTFSFRRLIGNTAWILLALFVLYWAWIFGCVLCWRFFNPTETAFMAAQLTVLQQKNPEAKITQQWVDYEHISANLKRAVVAAEDDRFVEHSGFDWESLQQAVENELQHKKSGGGSTISQQLAKNLFLSSERSYIRKAQEAVITVMIETMWSKKRILEVYLNVAEWGSGIFGAEAAARHYYGISAAGLNERQAARLAVMLPNPRRYQQRYPAGLARHAARIQRRMKYSDTP